MNDERPEVNTGRRPKVKGRRMNKQTEKFNKKLFDYLYGHLPTETDAAISMMCKQIGQIGKDTDLKFVIYVPGIPSHFPEIIEIEV